MAFLLNSKPLLWSFYNAINAILIFCELFYAMTLLGGWIADSLLNKFRTIFIFIFYIVGYCFWPRFRYIYIFRINTSCLNSSNLTLWCVSSHNHPSNFSDFTERTLSDESCSWVIFLSFAIMGIGFRGFRAYLVPFGASQVKTFIFLL